MKSVLKPALIVLLLYLVLRALPSDADPVAPPPEVAAHVASLEGTWAGGPNHTPFGPMDMAFSFTRQDDGSVRALSAQSPETWIELHFFEEDGRWRFRETAAMEGLGVQGYVMDLTRAQEGTYVWEVVDQPGFMTCHTRVDEHGLHLRVEVRGELHAEFQLPKLEGEAATKLAEHLALAEQMVDR